MKFLVTNDDGFDAPGIVALTRAAEQFGEVTVIAPDEHQSGCSHQTTGSPLTLTEMRPRQFKLNGWPADCTRVGLTQLGLENPVVLSGVNAGGNLGVDTFMSGTVAATREAAIMGAPAIALSCYRPPDQDYDWDGIASWTQFLLKRYLPQSLPAGWFWNINLALPLPEIDIANVIECELNSHPLEMEFLRLETGEYHYQGDYHGRPRDNGTDVQVCMGDRKVAVTKMAVMPPSGPQ